MAQQTKNDYEGTFNSVTVGLFKDNTSGDIEAVDHRLQVTNTKDSVPFTLDDSYTWPFPQVTASGTDTYAATLSPAITAYALGQKFQILFTNANTGAATLNLNAVGALAITKNGATALAAGDIAAGSIKILAYDGTRLQIIGDGGGGGTAATTSFTPAGNIAATDVQAAIEELDTEKAPLASPTFTGTPAAPTAAAATNTTQVATTAFVQQEIASKVDEETFATLTFASPTVWNNNSRQSPLAKVTATGDFTLDMTNVKSGAQGVLIVTASTASAFTLTFDTDFTNTEISTGASLLTYTFPADNGQVYYLFYVCDGTSLAWTIVDLQATDPTPFAQIARSTAQSINNNDTSVPVTFATEVHDNSAIWASSPNPTRFVIPGSGDKVAYISIRAQWAVNSTGMRRNIPYLNGSTTGDIAQAGAIASTATILNTTHQIACAGGDYIEIVCYQNSGSALDLDLCQVRVSIVDR